MLNIPETLIVNNFDILRSSSGTTYTPANPDAFLYLSNPPIVPSQGNLPSLPLVQKLYITEHPRLEE
jgi:hypothetical protein